MKQIEHQLKFEVSCVEVLHEGKLKDYSEHSIMGSVWLFVVRSRKTSLKYLTIKELQRCFRAMLDENGKSTLWAERKFTEIDFGRSGWLLTRA